MYYVTYLYMYCMFKHFECLKNMKVKQYEECDKKYTLSTSDEKTEVKWQTILVVNGEFKYLAILSK